jgi:Tripartite tricarboxylate transporter TctB family
MRSDVIGGLSWLGVGLLILAESWRMERFTKMGATLYTMPGFIPGILGCILAVLGLALAWRGRNKPDQAPVSASDTQRANTLFNRRIRLALPLCLVYSVALLGRVPFWFATATFVAVFTYGFTPDGVRPIKRCGAALLSGLLTSAVVIGVFQYVFLVRLP